MTRRQPWYAEPMAETKPIRTTSSGRLLCHAKSKSTGELCSQVAIPGGKVCRYHGGASGHVKRAAALRLQELVDPAISTLAREMTEADKSTDRLRAADSVLDRTGFGRTTKMETEDVREMLLQRIRQLKLDHGEDPDDTEEFDDLL